MQQRMLQCHNVTMTSKITILVLVDERFFSINVQRSRIEQNILRRSTIRATLLAITNTLLFLLIKCENPLPCNDDVKLTKF